MICRRADSHTGSLYMCEGSHADTASLPSTRSINMTASSYFPLTESMVLMIS